MSILINKDKCTSCGECTKTCPCYIFEIKDGASKASVVDENVDKCISCGHCVASCAFDAISCGDITVENCSKIDKSLMPEFNSVKTFLKSRRSIRTYKDDSLSKEQLEELIDVAKYAPTGKNSQTIKWAVVMGKEKVNSLAGMVVDWMRFLISQNNPMAEQFNFSAIVEGWENGVDGILRGAPHLVIAYSHKDDIFGPGSAPLCLEYFELAAHGKGYGTCWAGFFEIALKYWPALKEAVNVPEDNVSLGSLMLGYPDETYQRFPARNTADLKYI